MKKPVFLFVSIFFLVSCTPGETPDFPGSRDEHQPGVEITLIPADTLPVESLSDLYPDPVLEFGLSRTNVIQRLGAPYIAAKDGIVYANFSRAAPYVMYVFQNDQLSGTLVMVLSSFTKPLAAYLVEKYLPVVTEGEPYFFINSTAEQEPTILVAVTLGKAKFWNVVYLPSYSADPAIHRKLEALMQQLY
ncbi:MAG: hypothetical protein WC128_05160 [Bacteroidales bacterium]|jgi:hypothetical protein